MKIHKFNELLKKFFQEKKDQKNLNKIEKYIYSIEKKELKYISSKIK